MEDQRHDSRRRVLKSGQIRFSGETVPCTVRNLSDSGAAIEITSPVWFPERFVLVVESEGIERPCHIVRREDRRLGVKFD